MGLETQSPWSQLSDPAARLQSCVLPGPINLAFLSAQQHCFKRGDERQTHCLPPQGHHSRVRLLRHSPGRWDAFKMHFKDKTATITFWEVPITADKGRCGVTTSPHTASLPAVGVAGGQNAISGC